MITLREAGAGDGEVIFNFVHALATYEKLAHEVVTSAVELEARLTAPHARVHALIAEQNGTPIGMALYFYNFSTFRGRHGIYIEDLYVEPAARGLGVGQQLLKALAVKAQEEGCARVEWWVLDWNEPAIGFYKKIGAVAMDEWTVYRLEGESLSALAAA